MPGAAVLKLEVLEEDCKFLASLVCTESSRLLRTAQQDPVPEQTKLGPDRSAVLAEPKASLSFDLHRFIFMCMRFRDFFYLFYFPEAGPHYIVVAELELTV